MADLISNEIVESTMMEVKGQNTQVLGDYSAGCILLETDHKKGYAGIINAFEAPKGGMRRSSDVTLVRNTIERLEFVSPKANRISAYQQTKDIIKKMGAGGGTSGDEGSLQVYASDVIGKAHASDEELDYINLILGAGGNAISSVVGLTHDINAATVSTMNFADINTAAYKFGDKQSDLRCIVMHSKPWSDLVNSTPNGATFQEQQTIAGTIYYGSPNFPNKTFLVTDSPSLVYDNTGVNNYITMMLVVAGLTAIESESTDLVTNDNNLVGGESLVTSDYRYTPEMAVKGFAFDKTIENPTEAQLFAGANWTMKVADVKNAAGVAIISE